jgi:hypothetical protein
VRCLLEASLTGYKFELIIDMIKFEDSSRVTNSISLGADVYVDQKKLVNH